MYWPYWCRLEALSWYLSTIHSQGVVAVANGIRHLSPAGLMIGALSLPIGLRWACLILGRSFASPASSFARPAVVAKARTALEGWAEVFAAATAARSGRVTHDLEAMAGGEGSGDGGGGGERARSSQVFLTGAVS